MQSRERILTIGKSLLLLGFILALLFAPAKASRAQNILTGKKLAVMPCRLGKAMPRTPAAQKKIIDCTHSELCYLEGNPMAEAADIITGLLQNELQKRFDGEVVPLQVVRQHYDPQPENPDETLGDMAVGLGKKLGVDYILAATLWRYDEREGTSKGVKQPASVAFAVFLVDVDDGKVSWQDTFNRTQAPLSENVLDLRLYMKEGFRWLTAGEFAEYGIEKMFTDFLGK